MKEVSNSTMRLITIIALGAQLLTSSASAQPTAQSSDADGPVLRKEVRQMQQATLDSVARGLAPLKAISTDIKAAKEAAESASTKFAFFGAGLAVMIAVMIVLANRAVEAQADLRKTDRDYADRLEKGGKDFADRLEKVAKDFGDKLEKGLKELGDRIEKSDKALSDRLIKFEERIEKTSKEFADELTKSNKEFGDKLTEFSKDLALMRQENAHISDSSKYTIVSMRQDNVRAAEDAKRSLSDLKDILLQEVRQELKEIKITISPPERSNYFPDDPYSSSASHLNALRQRIQDELFAQAAERAAKAATGTSTGSSTSVEPTPSV